MKEAHWGLIPGPLETLEQFQHRVERAHSQKEACPQALDLIERLFGARPDWIAVEWGARGLLPWEPAATWIEESEAGVLSYRIQIHPRTWYPKEEVIAHEMVHAMRLGFEESGFEEILAYRTARSAFRRYFGPLFRTPGEIKAFLSLLLLPWGAILLESFTDWTLFSEMVVWIPFVAFAFILIRLVCAQRTFASCLHHLQGALKDPKDSLAVALRLTDAEVRRFAGASPTEIAQGVQAKSGNFPRWEQIRTFF